MKKIKIIPIIAIMVIVLTGCNEAATASHNVSREADNFKSIRQVTFINNVTGEYLLTVTGNCSISVDSEDSQLELICKTGEEAYQKHFLGLNETTSYFVEELGTSEVDPYHYEVIWRPTEIIPNVEIQTPEE